LEECLAGDGVALIPTDTVYGLACNPESQTAFFAREPALESLSELGPRTCTVLGTLLPGPVTLLIENSGRRFPLACDPGGGSGVGLLGLRVPLLEGPLTAMSGIRLPAAQSSANLSGGADPRDLQSVPVELREGVDLVLDGGELPGVASTVIDLSEYEQSGRWRIVREGPLDAAFLQTALAGSC
jgi:L-threonylcarbamoyladenylate synthase